MTQEAGKALMKENRPTSLIQRLINQKEIGGAVSRVVSGKAAANNRAMLRVDGGLVRSIA